MENVVSARRLRKSTYKDLKIEGLNSNSKKRNKKESLDFKENGIRISFKSKLIIKTFISVLIVFICLVCKLLLKDKIMQNQIVSNLIKEYKKDISKLEVTEKSESLASNIYGKIKYAVPESIKEKIKDEYYANIKDRYLNFNLVSFTKKLISNESINTQLLEEKNDKAEEENQEAATEEIYEESISAISSMNEDIGIIKSKNISMIAPTNGTITSVYGARDEIFEGVNSYHTGVDIANRHGTQIVSSTTGKVVAAVYGNKYYGNYVEVETDGVIFKYAHMESLSVKEGDNINQGEEVGHMGSTGMSTGPHLHFEIKIDSKTVDPQELVSL